MLLAAPCARGLLAQLLRNDSAGVDGCHEKHVPVQAQAELLSCDLVKRLIDTIIVCRERFSAANADIDVEQLSGLNALLFGPRELPESCS